jgi:hypothetical protein
MSRRLIITGGSQPREFVLVGSFVVGRDPTCDLSEQDPLLSRRHVEFVENKDEVTVRDLASRNGILINGIKKPQGVLRGGDVVQVGSLQVKFMEDAGPFLNEFSAHPAPRTEVIAATVIQPEPLPGELDPTAVLGSLDRTVVPTFDSLADSPTIRLDLLRFVGPGGRFRFDMPALGWRIISGGSMSLVTLAHDGGAAAMVIERAPRDPGMSTIISSETFVVSERDIVRNQQPEAEVIDAGAVTFAGRRLVIVNYSRPGAAAPERARQYSYAKGAGVYRLTCSAVASRFTEFEPVFAQVAATFEIESSS